MAFIKKNLPGRYLLFIDCICIVISYILAACIRYSLVTRYWYYNIFGWVLVFTILLYVGVFLAFDSYKEFSKRSFFDELIEVCKLNTILSLSVTAFLFLTQEGAAFSRLFFLLFFLLNILITYTLRQYFKWLLLGVYKKSRSNSKIMIITTFSQAEEVLKQINNESTWEYVVTYLTILDRDMAGKRILGIPVKANESNMFEVARQEALDGVFIHLPSDYSETINLEETIKQFKNMGVDVSLSIHIFGLKLSEQNIQNMSGYHVLTFSHRVFNEYQLHIKRLTDILGGLVGCILTVIVGIFIAPAIVIETPGPVLFKQTRVGKNGRRFQIYKFRSMCAGAEEKKAELLAQNEMEGQMFKITSDPRITRVGNFLRKTSLDEFPQFFNVLKGDMSLVGTRPPTEDEFLHYEGRHKRRLALNCGLTGLWQVSGRSDITDFEDVVNLDLKYIDNWSLRMDLKIIVKTIYVVLFARGSK
ncbi:exopolysaccharide biosynthesis polyprenyl glycosylphosphotransferase [Anaerocolumna jejuensis DSM 15929]|uniref:Exopolysaccharide biosynthesis polyprenyl glycosylphosphotransferase n=1 Tax=Anaerocolumna jejuensis DSM 15929 TaxID=1121322 RepID=A0A1M7BZG8_9FIRM|nr:sugar transferase [Anaerocolumna jejuensis]SHL60361.1 exopolysaccharide biosynthesis polyprenyl glycosylphosphotransferase [Anaerocolumna jejuensis DSM 15929]